MYRKVVLIACLGLIMGISPLRLQPIQAIIVDHTCSDISQIPNPWIQTVKDTWKWHYAHTSHGEQLTTGLERLESSNSMYNVEIGYSYLPESPAFCIFDGQENDTYITPDLYWETPEGRQNTQDVLDHNPSINCSGWAWCCQLDYYSQTEVQNYLTQMSALEDANPGVIFIYMTGNAQSSGEDGYNRWQNNELIRQHCRTNNKVLFDFADLDAWWKNPGTNQWEFSSYDFNGQDIPVEHPQYSGDEAGHTTYESCEQKGCAVWWLFALLAGWQPGPTTPTPTPGPTMTPQPCTDTGVAIWMPSEM
ncbi:hypothetical protein JW979_07910, partial [bacterium]|nr:hypothetical protein [candidate division CSSED10-310 bacterium]